MAATLDIIGAVVDRLKARRPELAVEFFPEKPSEYRLNHPKGALLVSYAGSRFGALADTGFVAQKRDIRLTITVVMRQLNGRGGAVEAVDAAREALFCWRPPDCQGLRLVAEQFLGETANLWQYALDLTCEAIIVDAAEPEALPVLTKITHKPAEEKPL
jgi:hypothetical protein